jgi:hypothetical protein
MQQQPFEPFDARKLHPYYAGRELGLRDASILAFIARFAFGHKLRDAACSPNHLQVLSGTGNGNLKRGLHCFARSNITDITRHPRASRTKVQ